MGEEDNIISVCVVRGEENFITRIADVRGNEFILPTVDYSKEYKGANRDKLYYNYQMEPSPREGYMGVWKWYVTPNLKEPDKDWVNSEYQKNLNPIEVIEDFKDKTKMELGAFLREGALPQCNHRRMFLFWNGSCQQGVLCEPAQLEQTDGGVRVKDDVYGLPCYDIKESDLLRTQWTQGIPERCLYRFLQLPQDSGYFSVRSPEKAVKQLLIKRLSWSFFKAHGLGTREDFKTFRGLMEALPEGDIIADISEYCHCPERVAVACWKIFSANVRQYVRCEDIETHVLRTLLERDEALQRRLHDEWQVTNQQKLEKEENEYTQHRVEFEERREALTEEQERLEVNFAELQKHHQTELVRMQRETQEAEACLEKVRAEAEHYEALGREGLRLVREKLSLAREEAAEFLADLALFGAAGETAISTSSAMPGRPVPMSLYQPGAAPEDWEEAESAETLLEELWENLKHAGVDEKHIPELAAFLYGAFRNNTSLLLAGPQGTAVADALSCAMAGHHAGVLDCCGAWEPAVLDDIMNGTDDVIIVKHPFLHRWIDHLLPELDATKKMWVFVHPYADDLPLEPSGLYQYALPLVLDLFMLRPASGDMTYCRKGKGYKDFLKNEEIRSIMGPLRKLSRNCYLETKVKQVMTNAYGVEEKGDEAFLRWACLLFPLAVALGRKDIFLEIIQEDSGLSQKDRALLEEALGEFR